MAETTVIASQTTGPVGFVSRFAPDQWPVRQEDLNLVIEQISTDRRMRVLSVEEARQRGPLPVYDVDSDGNYITDADGNLVQVAETAQLYAYVKWEPLTG